MKKSVSSTPPPSSDEIPKSTKEEIFSEMASQADVKTLMAVIPEKVKDAIWRSVQLDGACDEIRNQVALYNMADKKGFFFMSSAEARKAMEYIGDIRKGPEKYIPTPKEREQDEFIRTWKSAYLAGNVTVREEQFPDMTEGFSVDWMNRSFAIMEGKNVMVAVAMMSPSNYANVRGWGRTIYDEATNKEMLLRGMFGHLWTADIYVDIKLPDDHVILMSLPDKDHPFGMAIKSKIPILVEKPAPPGSNEILNEIRLLRSEIVPSPRVSCPVRTPSDRLWELIKLASSKSPLFRVKLEVGDFLDHALCPKPVRSTGYIPSMSGDIPDKIVEGESINVRLRDVDKDDWISSMEKFVEGMSELPGGRVISFYVSHGGIGQYDKLKAGICSYDAA